MVLRAQQLSDATSPLHHPRQRMVIEGRHRLAGEVAISGAKNAALPLLAATLLTDEKCIIENVPDIADIHTMVELLRDLGAKVELDLSKRLREAYQESFGFRTGWALGPLGADLMPTEDLPTEDGRKLTGLPVDLVKECREIVQFRVDEDLLSWELQRLAKAGYSRLVKDMSANTATTGGTLVGYPAQGELIDLLRAKEVMSQAGAMEIRGLAVGTYVLRLELQGRAAERKLVVTR